MATRSFQCFGFVKPGHAFLASGQKVEGGFRGREAFCPRASNCLRLLVQSRMPKQNFLPPYLNFFGGARNPKIGEENCVET